MEPMASPQLINVKSPTGDLVSLPQDQVQEAFKAGFSLPSPGEVESFFKEQEFGTLPQQALAGLEGAASGATFGLSTPLELATGLTTPENIQARREVNPITYGVGQGAGLLGSSLTPVGAGALLGKAGEAAAGLAGLGQEAIQGAGALRQIGSAALKGAVETPLFQAGDEFSKAFTDPHQTLETAALDVGLAGLLGAGVGGALGSVSPAWKALKSPSEEGFLQDLRQGLKYHMNNPDPYAASSEELGNLLKSTKNTNDLSLGTGVGEPAPWNFLSEDPSSFAEQYALKMAQKQTGELPVEQVGQELGNLYNHVQEQASQVFGNTGLKAQEIASKLPQKNAAIVDSLGDITQKLDTQLEKMRSSPLDYPANVVNRFESELNRFKNAALDVASERVPGTTEVLNEGVNKSSAEIYDALNRLKQDMWEYAKLEKRIPKTDPSYSFVQDARSLASDLKTNLEDVNIWGKAAERQSQINKAFSEYLPTLKDFEKVATEEINGERVISPKKIQGLLKNADEVVGKNNRAKLENFINASQKYLDEIGLTNKALGIEAPEFKESMHAVKELLGKGPQTEGARFAEEIFKKNQAIEEKFQPAYKDFIKKFGTDIAGEDEISSTKLQTFFRRKNKLSVGDTDTVLKNFMDAAKEYRESKAKLYAQLGKRLEGSPASLQKTAELMALPNSLGRQIADALYSHEQDAINPRMFEVKRTLSEKLQDVLEATGKRGLRKILPSILDRFLGAEVNPASMEAALQLASASEKNQEILSKAAKRVFSAEAIEPLLGSKAVDQSKKIAALDEKLKKIQENPEVLMSAQNDLQHYLPDHAMAQNTIIARAATYLNSLRPNPQKAAPLDPEPKADPVQKAKYENALTIAQNPLTVFSKIKSGTLTPEDLVHLNAIYPGAYQKMKDQILNAIAEHPESKLDYKTKISLSLFMAQPLDSTLMPQNIQRLQTVASVAPSDQNNKPVPRGTSHLEKISNMYLTPVQKLAENRS